MRRLFSLILFVLCTLAVNAGPAQPGIWRTLTLPDGTTIEAELCGDEFVHYWRTTGDKLYIQTDAGYKLTTESEINAVAYSRRALAFKESASGNAMSRRLIGAKYNSALVGSKKAVIILVDFPDKKFSMDNPKDFYSRMANEVNYVNGRQKGSIHDYFKKQSEGKFLLNFDIVGPVTMDQNSTVYGGDEGGNTDVNVGTMICKAITMANNEVNWKDYDWNGDNEVEQVYIIYAGAGQATGGGADTVWPHKYQVSAYAYTGFSPMNFNGVKVDVYACSNEIGSSKQTAGIGTICHEFSHCLGFPDLYDTTGNSGATKTQYGMGSWDLMNSGSHNSGGYCPPNYTCWEKMVAGWITPTEIKGDHYARNIKALQHGGESFVIYNEVNKNEYYMIENRQKEGWDAAIASSGLLIMHIDYDKAIFDYYNAPNTLRPGINDHQRFTIYHADNTATDNDEATDPYPFGWNNLLSKNSMPALMAYNLKDGASNLLDVKISRIEEHDDGSMSFCFGDPVKGDKSIIFAESFDNCVGTGANDENWMSFKTATGEYKADNDGWVGDYKRGGFLCGRFGSSATNASVQTPEIAFTGDCSVWLKAAGFGMTSSKVTVSSDNPAVTVENAVMEVKTDSWTVFTMSVKGAGVARLSFAGNGPFYLDDIIITDQNATGISHPAIYDVNADGNAYSISGQRVDSSYRGIVIQNGRKTIRR